MRLLCCSQAGRVGACRVGVGVVEGTGGCCKVVAAAGRALCDQLSSHLVQQQTQQQGNGGGVMHSRDVSFEGLRLEVAIVARTKLEGQTCGCSTWLAIQQALPDQSTLRQQASSLTYESSHRWQRVCLTWSLSLSAWILASTLALKAFSWSFLLRLQRMPHLQGTATTQHGAAQHSTAWAEHQAQVEQGVIQ